MNYVQAKKRLGQHFLKDKNIAQKIVDSLSINSSTSVLEIGPGMGVLTHFLLQKEIHSFKVIEIDKESVEFLKQNFPALKENIIEGDFLQYNLSDFSSGNFSIIGNFPYNISSQIFFKVVELKGQISEIVGMLQKEVAERISSGPGSKKYGILSVLLQLYYDIEYLFTVHEDVFIPPPKVKSAVIRLKRNSRVSIGCDESLFIRVVKAAFNQRRKMLRNSLKSYGFYVADEFSTLRPEQISVEMFISLAIQIENHTKN